MDKNAGKVVPFVPTPEQLRLADVLLNNKRVIILKARQIGASTIVRAYFTWKALLSEEPIHSGIMSLTHESASYLHSLDKGFISSLPSALRRRLDTSNTRTIKFSDTGAQLRSFTAGMKGGGTRSFAMTDLHLSEFAHYDDQQEVLSNAVSTVGAGGQIVIETTANGPGDVYHKLCTSHTDWTVFFSPWFKHKAYTKFSNFGGDGVPMPSQAELLIKQRHELTLHQLYWRHSMIATMGPDKFVQEYPGTVEEAFVATSKTWLQKSDIDAIEVRKAAGREMCLVDDMKLDPLVLGVDVAGGNNGDYTAVTAVSITTGQPIWHYHCNDETPARISEHIIEWSAKWPIKTVLIESNGYGGIVLQRLRDCGFDKKKLWLNAQGKDWTTNRETKILLFDLFRQRLLNGDIVAVAEPLYKELINLENGKWTPSAPKGMHDDLAISTALALYAHSTIPSLATSSQKEKLMEQWIKTQRVSRLLSGDRLPWKRNTLCH